MSRNRKLIKVIRKNYRKFCAYIATLKKQFVWLLQTLLVAKNRRKSPNAGFVLPTVAMVSIVVVLLTVAIVFRSFERAKNASNVRVNEAVVNAAMPALDRAQAKIEQLLNDPSLPRSTPSDVAIYDVIKNNKRYDFGDENRLKLGFDIDKDNSIESNLANLQQDETLNTAWTFPIDTNNNGKFDTYTLYGIYFRSPTRSTSTNTFNRPRNPLEARTPPMDKSQIGGACAAALGTSASLVGDSDWYKAGGTLAKSFLVYTVNVPIENTAGLGTNFEKGKSAFSALEYQQDRERIPINNKAVWFQNDLEITPGSVLELNGAVHTDSNLLASGQYADNAVVFRQVSSEYSCFYDAEYAKITVGGNFGDGNVSQDDGKRKKVVVHRFNGYRVAPVTNTAEVGASTTEKSTTLNGGRLIGHNDAAYDRRISRMKNEALDICTTCTTVLDNPTGTVQQLKTAVAGVTKYPQAIKDNFEQRVEQSAGIDKDRAYDILGDEIELYLRNRTRRVPFAEVSQAIPTDAQALGSFATGSIFSGSGEIEVPQQWREIGSTNTGLTLSLDKLSATEPAAQKDAGKELNPGDRMLLGNNLPAYWKNDEGRYVSGQKARQRVNPTSNTFWNAPANNNKHRTRASQIEAQLNLGVTERNDFWEQKAAEDNSANPLANVGGLRVVTGAGIYVDDNGVVGDVPSYPRAANSFLATPTLDGSFVGAGLNQMPLPAPFNDSGVPSPNIVAWSDAMPMTNPANSLKGDLLMRATAVYHYKGGTATASLENVDRTPIACVSSYYDPTNETTARNGNYNGSPLPVNYNANGKSNNGVAYTFPGRSINATTLNTLKRQSRLVFPNGRIVNEPLRNAIEKYSRNGNFTNFTLEDYSAVDTALCSIAILNNTATVSNAVIAHDKIKEASFLDSREIKAIQNFNDYQTGVRGDYGLDLEQRQPLEVRVTEIDIGYLAATPYGTGEYLLPNSGIIYATRDDALEDLSFATINTAPVDPNRLSDPKRLAQIELFSQTDFKLDPTRRPNGIRLINGGVLARSGANLTYNQAEKGLILVSNLPVYVEGDFNLHRTSSTATTQIEEFTQTVSGTGFYGRTTPNSNYACRPGRTGCPATGGDLWRPSTIISDAITLLSGSFRDGFRNHGDYDLRDNSVTIPNTALVNNFVTTANWANTSGYPNTATANYFKTSYLANGITPIQRRTSESREYLMEVCTNVPASTCGDGDWFIRPAAPGVTALKISDITTDGTVSLDIPNTHQAGTTAQPAALQYRSYARRVAFLRNNSNQLLDSTGSIITVPGALPVPIGITGAGAGRVQRFPYSTFSVSRPRPASDAPAGSLALWFRTTNNAASPNNIANVHYGADNPLFIQGTLPTGTQQPQLVPVLQIFSPEGTPTASNTTLNQGSGTVLIQKQWVQQATQDMIVNSAFVSGNSPSRPEEESAGLGNFVRFLEYWGGDGNPQYRTNISGSFIQFKRSSYSTAPFSTILSGRVTTGGSVASNISFFDYLFNRYVTNKGLPEGTLPYYTPPSRTWGLDVALLSQLPDLFAQRFTVPPSGPPADYFRQVSKDDPWINALLCSKKQPSSSSASTPWSEFVVPQNYRPSNCPTSAYPS
ncbi:hypothetical protein DSM106972_098350 [Dulcicalothrix desertica PCC 7102]|uniref:Uncharacterized protein n=1 Tax=Dulcicalothrix desertica PCC 7102 TaxID=232991 RepID=A0A3S1BPB9_9CYAN|nr:hormogonium polysaccharide biosynthesis protein HpsA [Dulcicalothrix desertica]RUS92687.1 hypothetical protein DSM106972_098350 [Dulcicalothrix desertica PCC 7102]TWH49944.1 hypothetical protein CAL7102_04213 [Dulcicalothrix desertica PCC 7102]